MTLALRSIWRWVIGAIVTLWVGGPIAWLAFTSIRVPVRVFQYPPTLAGPFTFANYRYVFDSLHLAPYLVNSVTIDLLSTAAAVVFGLAAAYAISNMGHSPARLAHWFVVSCRMVPSVALIVPVYFFYDKIHLLNNRFGLALMYTATGLPLVIWMLSAYLSQVPDEVLQAAQVDGAGIVRMLRSVLAPMMVPGIVAVAVLTFLANWSEFMLAVTLTSSSNSATLPVALVQLNEVYGVEWQYLSAAVMVAIAIPVIVGAVLQRRIVAGITAGAVK